MATKPLLLTPEHVQHVREQGLVLISPHLDDVAFSIGHLVEQVGGGLLINVFSRSLHLARLPAAQTAPLTESDVAAIRHAEDEQFAQRCGLQRLQLGLPGPELLGRRPNDPAGLAADVAAARPALAGALEQARQMGKRPYLWAPMGVGRHVNHQAVHQVVRELAPELLPHFRLGFYEDLPYAHQPFDRLDSLRLLGIRWRNADFARHVQPCTWNAKRRLLAMYPSQLRHPPSAYRFRPASIWPLGMHEALWLRPQDLPARGAA